jgi:hypothetical protein
LQIQQGKVRFCEDFQPGLLEDLLLRLAVLVKTGIGNRDEIFGVGESVIFTVPKFERTGFLFEPCA